MQLLVSPETSMDIETKMTTLTTIGKTTNGIVADINNKLVNDIEKNVENAIVNEDSVINDKDKTNPDSTTNGNDLKETIENITNTEIENGNLTNITEEVGNLPDICVKATEIAEKSHNNTIEPVLITNLQSVDELNKIQDSSKCETLITQDLQDSIIIVNKNEIVKGDANKSNEVIETAPTQDNNFDKGIETVANSDHPTLNNILEGKNNDTELELENKDISFVHGVNEVQKESDYNSDHEVQKESVSDSAVVLNEINVLCNDDEKMETQLEHNDSLMSVDDDSQSRNQTEQSNDNNKIDNEVQTDDKPSQEMVTESHYFHHYEEKIETVSDSAVVLNEINVLCNDDEKMETQLEHNDSLMSVDDDSKLTNNKTEESNDKNKTDNEVTDTESSLSNKSESSVIRHDMHNTTLEEVKNKEDISTVELNAQTDDIKNQTNNFNSKQITDKETVVNNKEEKEKIVEIEEKGEFTILEQNNCILGAKSEDQGNAIENLTKDIDNKPQTDKETKIVTEAESENKVDIYSCKLREMLTQPTPRIKLSNSMNILSDDDDDVKPRQEDPEPLPAPSEQKCINLVEDDDCMLIDEDTSKQKLHENNEKDIQKTMPNNDKSSEMLEEKLTEASEEADTLKTKDDSSKIEEISPVISEKEPDVVDEKKTEKPLIPKAFLQNCKRKLSDMTRDDLEEFCVLKIAEAVIDRTNLSDIKSKLKTMNQNIEEYKKKATLLTRQNRDLQVVLKSVQEEQKQKTNAPITPLKITRSVGMQVVMVDKPVRRKPILAQAPNNNTTPNASPNKLSRINNTNNNQRQSTGSSNPIPVPRLVPAQSFSKPVAIPGSPKPNVNNVPNVFKKSPSATQKPEKRTLSRQQSTSNSSQSDTVDLTDDEPPAKANRTATTNMPVRLVQQQSLMAPRVPNLPQTANQRKVYIPISSNQSEGLKVGQKIMLRGIRPPDPAVLAQQIRGPSPGKVLRLPNTPQRLPRPNMTMRHPAPLPDSHKQYQPPNWKSVPPAPDLKLSKVENGIVISWKIDGYLEDKFEEIASYQLYAYQETTAPPNTLLWKKIGDVKALPLPMACTLTQFMAGYKYYFAVRAVDVRSRVGPFSMPGSILLLNKV